jgi:hypothetical protein
MLLLGREMFDLRSLAFWVDHHNPSHIEMNDGQYAWYANLCSANRKDFREFPSSSPVIKYG